MIDPHFAPAFSINIEGLTLSADVTDAVVSLQYDNNIDTADMFSLTLNNADLGLADSELFNVGKNVEIYMGYAGDLHPMMLGEITAVNPSFPADGAPTLQITGYDKSHRMRHNRPERMTFKYINDSLVAAQIAAENLLIPIVDPAPTIRESIQQTGSDWALLSALAKRNFMQVYVHWDKLYFRYPRPQMEMVALRWGKNLSSFSPRLSTSGQYGIQVLRGYDYKLAEKIVAILPVMAVGGDIDNIIERVGSDFLQQLVQLGRYAIRNKSVSNYLDAAELAKSVLLQLLEGLFEGSGSCIGLPQLRAGDLIEIQGVGQRFGGKYRLSRVTHTIDEGGYQTQFEVTQRGNSTFLQSLRGKLGAPSAPDGQEPIQGMVIGRVENNVDVEGLGRVQLSFPELSDVNLSQWARVAAPMAGKLSGTYLLPDVKDEVLVTFVNGDVNQPVVVGGLWNGKNRPPEVNMPPSITNDKKVIKLKSGMHIMFDETKTQEMLQLKDKSGSTITMKSNGDIVIEAKNNVVIKSGAAGKIDLNPPG